jgi:transposase
MGTTIHSAKTKPASWNAFDDIGAFVDAVIAELGDMQTDGIRVRTAGPKAAMGEAQLRRAVIAIWCVCFCGLPWRAIGKLSGIPFGTLYALFSRWTRLGLWNRLMLRFAVAWRTACGDKPMPSVLVIDSRSVRSAPTCGFRGIDGGKRIRGVKFHLVADKHGSPFAVDVSPANDHDAKGCQTVLEEVAAFGFSGKVLGDLAYRGEPLDTFAKTLKLLGVMTSAGGHDGVFIPAGIRWTIERTFGWSVFYRRLNLIWERKADHMVAFFEMMAASILSRRLARLVSP